MSIDGVRMAIVVDAICKVIDGIGEEIVRICDNGGGVGEDFVWIGVSVDTICEYGDGKCMPGDDIGEGIVPTGEGGEWICEGKGGKGKPPRG